MRLRCATRYCATKFVCVTRIDDGLVLTEHEISHGRRMMATRLTGCCLCVLLITLPGCGLWSKLVRRDHAPPPRVLASDATRDEILIHLNNERARLVGWRSTDVRISARGEGIVAPKLSARLSIESPRKLRLMASSLRGEEVDFGSNDDRFWFWMRASKPKYILTGSHDVLEQQPSMPLPFPPSWLMEALGVIPIDPLGIQMLRDPATPDQVRLISSHSLQGQSVQRIMVVDLSLGQITEHALYDAQEKLIASASMSDFRSSQAGTTLPHSIELHWPQTGTELTLKINSIEVNPSMPGATWQVPTYPNYRIVDLDREYGRVTQ